MITNATPNQLSLALINTNEKFGGNIIFYETPKRQGNQYRFRLTVLDSSGPGARRGRFGQKIKAACWHVHGTFFDELFKINPDAYIITRGRRITKDEGNWEDENIGSRTYPFYFSEACDCGG